MYDRAPRKLTSAVGSTPGHVGPGTYGRHELTSVKQLSDGYAPFNSLSTRDTNLVPESIIIAPGPGQYDPKAPQDAVKGASSLLNRSQRFQLIASEVPGPGAYNIKTKWTKPDCVRQLPCSAPAATTEKSSKRQPTSSVSQVKYNRQPVAPSIPCPGQAFGYEETDDGGLHRQAPPKRDTSIGPAYYNPAVTETQTTKTYKGIHWGQMKAGRTNFAGKDGPGPGEYDIRQAKSLPENLSLQDANNKFESYIPRFTDQIVIKEKKQGNPGPGSYKVAREFDEVRKPRVIPQVGEMLVTHPPFLTQSKRFDNVKSEVPPPGAYNDPRGALDSLKKTTGIKHSPFGMTSVRFDRDRRAGDAPAPNMYSSMRGMAAESMYKAYLSSTQRGAFGSTTERRNPMISRDAVNRPGPGAYQVADEKECSRQCNRGVVRASANFVSQSERISKPIKSIVEAPPPTAYDVERAFQATQSKKEPRPPRNEVAKRRHESFMSSTARFAPPRDVIVAEADPSLPGPGAYEPRVVTEKGNMMTVRESRDKPLKDGNPGPGYYDFSPLIMDTVLRGTFNVTLCNPPPPSRWFAEKKVCPETVIPVQSSISAASIA